MEDQTGNIILDRTTSGGADAGDELLQEGNLGLLLHNYEIDDGRFE